MIFITVGSQKFQFNRLLKKIDELIECKVINEEVFAQIGASDYKPKNFRYRNYLNGDEFKEYIKLSDIVITHGGTGVIMGAVKQGKKVIAVPRLKRYGEHVDDHQLQLICQFTEQNLICGVQDCEELENVLKCIKSRDFNTYTSNTQLYISSIETFLESIN